MTGATPGKIDAGESAASPTGLPPLRRLNRVLIVVLLFELILISATWRLWFAASSLPRVPMFALFLNAPQWLVPTTSGLFVSLVASLLGIRMVADLRRSLLISASWLQPLTLTTIVSGLFPILLNQHCLQAWHWLTLLMLLASLKHSNSAAATSLQTMRMTVACIYLYSSVSRMKIQIAESMTGQVAHVLAGFLSLRLSENQVTAVCWCFAGGELLAGLFLMSRRTRRTGVLLAMTMHLLLLLALGPLGLNHHVGVLLWNTCLITLVPTLFLKTRSDSATSPAPTSDVALGTQALRAGVFLIPLLGLFGISDNWISWQLYSPRTEVWTLQIHLEETPHLPVTLQPFAGPPVPMQEWRPVRVDRWCLESTGAPLYPEDRFQLAILAELIQAIPEGRWRISISEPQTAFWKPHQHRSIVSQRELQQAQDEFRLNAKASPTY